MRFVHSLLLCFNTCQPWKLPIQLQLPVEKRHGVINTGSRLNEMLLKVWLNEPHTFSNFPCGTHILSEPHCSVLSSHMGEKLDSVINKDRNTLTFMRLKGILEDFQKANHGWQTVIGLQIAQKSSSIPLMKILITQNSMANDMHSTVESSSLTFQDLHQITLIK